MERTGENKIAKRGTIEQLGPEAQEKTIKLYVSGMTYQSIADELNSLFNPDIIIKSKDVENFLRRKQKATAIVMKEDKNFQSKLYQGYWDTISQLKSINSEIVKFFYELRKDPEYVSKTVICPHCHKKMQVQLKTFGTLLKTADTLLNQIRHVDSVLGRMQKKSLNISYNYVDLSKKIGIVMPNMLVQLEKRGLIKLNKKKLKQYYGDKKMEDEFEEEEEQEEDDDEDDLD